MKEAAGSWESRQVHDVAGDRGGGCVEGEGVGVGIPWALGRLPVCEIHLARATTGGCGGGYVAAVRMSDEVVGRWCLLAEAREERRVNNSRCVGGVLGPRGT